MSGVNQAIEKAGKGDVAEGKRQIATALGITPQAISNFERKGWFPLERARQVSELYGIPLADLVRPDIRQTLLSL